MVSDASIIVVGTSHPIQTADLELKPFLEGVCREFNVRAVAEEMSEEALSEKRCSASIPMQVASALEVPHRFCDPNRAERGLLGILQENEIRLQAWSSNSSLSNSDVAACVMESDAKREAYWLDQLRSLNIWPVLFICGADHVTSFCGLLAQHSIAAHVAANDWEPNKQVAIRPHQVNPKAQ